MVATNVLQTIIALLNSLVNHQTPEDLRSPQLLKDNERYDFIIAGGGTAGCVLASRLSEIGNWSVLLLEAGGEEPYEIDLPGTGYTGWETRINWNYSTVPEELLCGGEFCSVPRGKVLGGSSSINALIYNRGNRRDYDHWAQAGNPGWDYDSILPYFKKSENNLDPDIAKDKKYHGTGGYLDVKRFRSEHKTTAPVKAAFKELGYHEVDFNAANQTGYMIYQANQFNSLRKSNNKAFLEPVRNRTNLKVITNVRVTKILIDPKTKNAQGIEYIAENNANIKGRIFANKEVIVSCGAVASPVLLMQSGIGPKEVLDPLGIKTIKSLEVGRNLQDHSWVPVVNFEYGEYEETNISVVIKDLIDFSKDVREGENTKGAIDEIIAFAKTKYENQSIDYPDLEITFSTASATSKKEKNTLRFNHSVNRPKSRGKISINSTDPFARPLIYPNYFSDPEDIKRFVDGINIAKKMANTQAFKKYGLVLNTSLLSTDVESFKAVLRNPYWKDPQFKPFFSNYHLSGTCKMGPKTDNAAVVDSSLKVHGVNKLRVIDASIIPYQISANLNAGVTMIAEKGADMIKESHGIPIKRL